MAKFNLTLPKMGESVDEATIVSWLKNVGDEVSADEVAGPVHAVGAVDTH